MLLTGTPLQNSVDELFSLLNFLEPQTFPSHLAFLQQFGKLKTEEQVEELKAVSWERCMQGCGVLRAGCDDSSAPHPDLKTDDAAPTEGGCGEEYCSERRDHH